MLKISHSGRKWGYLDFSSKGRPFGPHWGGGGKWRPFCFRSPSWVTSFANEVIQDGDRKQKGSHLAPPSNGGLKGRPRSWMTSYPFTETGLAPATVQGIRKVPQSLDISSVWGRYQPRSTNSMTWWPGDGWEWLHKVYNWTKKWFVLDTFLGQPYNKLLDHSAPIFTLGEHNAEWGAGVSEHHYIP